MNFSRISGLVACGLLQACLIGHRVVPGDTGPDMAVDHEPPADGGPLEGGVDVVEMDADVVDVTEAMDGDVVEMDADVVDAQADADAGDARVDEDVVRPPVILWQVNFSRDTPGVRPGALPGGLSLTRPSPATVQTSSTNLVVVMAPDSPRIASTPGVGLLIEEARTNLLAHSRSMETAAWTAGSDETLTRDFAAGPDGAMFADRNQVMAYGYSRGQAPEAPLGRVFTASLWVRSATASPSPFQTSLFTGVSQIVAGTATTAWARHAVVARAPSTGRPSLRPVDARDLVPGGPAPTDMDVLTDFMQLEEGAFATSAIVSFGAPASRAADRLRLATAAAIVDVSGGLSLQLSVHPLGAAGDYRGPIRVWTVDATHYAEIDAGRRLTVRLDASVFTFPVALAWNAGDAVDLWVEAGGATPSRAFYRVNRGAAVMLGASPTPQGRVPTDRGIDLLGAESGLQFSSVLAIATAYAAGSHPEWVP